MHQSWMPEEKKRNALLIIHTQNRKLKKKSNNIHMMCLWTSLIDEFPPQVYTWNEKKAKTTGRFDCLLWSNRPTQSRKKEHEKHKNHRWRRTVCTRAQAFQFSLTQDALEALVWLFLVYKVSALFGVSECSWIAGRCFILSNSFLFCLHQAAP